MLIPALAEAAGEFKAGFTLKAWSIRDGDLGKYCLSALSYSLHGGLFVAPKWYRNEGIRSALITGMLLLGDIHI